MSVCPDRACTHPHIDRCQRANCRCVSYATLLSSGDGGHRDAIVAQDRDFQDALFAAIERGKENAPIGIDDRPCTKSPIFVPHGPGQPASSGAYCEDV